MKEEAPEIYNTLRGFSFLAPGGMLWIEYALRKGYRQLNNKRIEEAGDALCNAYMGFTGTLGIIWFVVSQAVNLK